jgi:hypothetical protein
LTIVYYSVYYQQAMHPAALAFFLNRVVIAFSAIDRSRLVYPDGDV